MTQLATRELANGQGNTLHPAAITYSMDDVWTMAEKVFQSKLFPSITNPQSAFVLMLLCQADGLHPIQVLRTYDIIDGKPAMKSAAIQAKFQDSGGVIEIVNSDATEARALFSHHRLHPKPKEFTYTIKDAQIAGLTGKKNWRENPTDMLWWRLVAKGVRKIHPGIVAGIYSVDEMRDMNLTDQAAVEVAKQDRMDALREKIRHPAAPIASEIADPLIVGYTGIGWDQRSYLRVAGDAVEFVNNEIRQKGDGLFVLLNELHKHVFALAIEMDYLAEPMPTMLGPAIKILDGLYRDQRIWVRETINAYLSEHVERQTAMTAEQDEAAESEPTADDEMTDAEARVEFGPGANG